MRGVALHNARLIHQHSMHRMDATPNSLQPQQPPQGFYANLVVRTSALHTSPHHPLSMLCVDVMEGVSMGIWAHQRSIGVRGEQQALISAI